MSSVLILLPLLLKSLLKSPPQHLIVMEGRIRSRPGQFLLWYIYCSVTCHDSLGFLTPAQMSLFCLSNMLSSVSENSRSSWQVFIINSSIINSSKPVLFGCMFPECQSWLWCPPECLELISLCGSRSFGSPRYNKLYISTTGQPYCEGRIKGASVGTFVMCWWTSWNRVLWASREIFVGDLLVPAVKPLPARGLEGWHTSGGGRVAEGEGAAGARTPAALSHWTADS